MQNQDFISKRYIGGMTGSMQSSFADVADHYPNFKFPHMMIRQEPDRARNFGTANLGDRRMMYDDL
jgi:hypothetical protein